MKNKILKITALVLLLVLGVLVAVPFFLESKIGDLIKNSVNNNIKGRLDFAEANLSLLRSFPNAELDLQDLFVLTQSPFEGDTLFKAESVSLKMGLKELFKGDDEPIRIKSLMLDRAILKLKIDEQENTNYDIAKEEEKSIKNDNASGGFTFALESYELLNSEVVYEDLNAGLLFKMSELEHRGNGDLSLEKSELKTSSVALVSFVSGNTNYLDNTLVKLEALLGIDLKTNTYSFLKNEGHINKLPLVFEGYIRNLENSQEIAINFKTPSSDFDNFLAIVPEVYAQNISEIKTTGIFKIEGEINGVMDDTHIPGFDIRVNAKDASVKYPDLSKSVSNINLNLDIKNTSGLAEDTYIDIEKASFAIDNDRFVLSSNITELLGNTKMRSHLVCNLDLGNISKAYPVPGSEDLNGKLDADISTSFDMQSIKNAKYEKTVLDGHLNIKDLNYKSDNLSGPLVLHSVAMIFSPSKVMLENMNGQLGNSDFKINGAISNLLGFLFNDEKVEGKFKMNSNTFDLGDFMSRSDVEEQKENQSATNSQAVVLTDERIQIPAILDCVIDANANTVVYDNLLLRNVTGQLKIADEQVVLSNFKSSLYNGDINLKGNASTKGDISSFSMNLDMSSLNLEDSFKNIELFRVLAPMAAALRGKLNSEIVLSGKLNDDFTPDLATISGNILAELSALKINPKEAKILNALNTQLNFIEADKFDLKTLKTILSFNDGKVDVKPFTIKYEDIAITVGGTHTFDQKLNYNLEFEVPRKYLGAQVNSLITAIDEKELDDLTLPVNASVSGSYKAPEINTDLGASVKELTSRLIEVQKQKLISKGSEKAGKLLGDIFTDKNNEKDTLNSGDKKSANLNDVLGKVLADQSKNKDSTVSNKDTISTEDPLTKKAKGILGGILGGNKKKTNATDSIKDSVN